MFSCGGDSVVVSVSAIYRGGPGQRPAVGGYSGLLHRVAVFTVTKEPLKKQRKEQEVASNRTDEEKINIEADWDIWH